MADWMVLSAFVGVGVKFDIHLMVSELKNEYTQFCLTCMEDTQETSGVFPFLPTNMGAFMKETFTPWTILRVSGQEQ